MGAPNRSAQAWATLTAGSESNDSRKRCSIKAPGARAAYRKKRNEINVSGPQQTRDRKNAGDGGCPCARNAGGARSLGCAHRAPMCRMRLFVLKFRGCPGRVRVSYTQVGLANGGSQFCSEHLGIGGFFLQGGAAGVGDLAGEKYAHRAIEQPGRGRRRIRCPAAAATGRRSLRRDCWQA